MSDDLRLGGIGTAFFEVSEYGGSNVWVERMRQKFYLLEITR